MTVLGGVANFIFLYPISHLGSFLFLAFTISLIIVYDFYRRGLSVHIIPAVAAVFCLCFVGFSIVGPNLPDETEIQGWLLPGNDPDIQSRCNFSAEGLSFVLGTNLVWAPANNRVRYVLEVNKTPLIAAVKDGDRLAFDVDIFDDSGVLAVRIEKK